MLELGPRWDNIAGRVSGPGTDLVTIQLPGEFSADLEQFILHPAVLDSAGGLGMNLAGEGMYLPFGYGRITVRAPLPARCHSIVRHLDDTRGEIIQAALAIVDDDGTELVAVEGYTLLRVAAPGAAGPDGKAAPATGISALASAPATAADGGSAAAAGLASPGPGEADGDVTPAEGAQALRAVLASRSGPQVIVCPGGIRRREQRANRITRSALVAYAQAGGTARSRSLATPYAAPESPAQQLLTEIWREAIGLDQIGVDDDFLELGGNSLVAVQLAAQISERLRASVSVAQLFESRTIRALAEVIDGQASQQGDPSVPGPLRALEASA
jgi:acyl carrier protein